MVQTLATLLMTYKSRPSLKDSQVVSKSLHQKFRKIGGEEYEVEPRMSTEKLVMMMNISPKEEKSGLCLQIIPDSADHKISNAANKRQFEEEWAKTKGQDHGPIKLEEPKYSVKCFKDYLYTSTLKN